MRKGEGIGCENKKGKKRGNCVVFRVVFSAFLPIGVFVGIFGWPFVCFLPFWHHLEFSGFIRNFMYMLFMPGYAKFGFALILHDSFFYSRQHSHVMATCTYTYTIHYIYTGYMNLVDSEYSVRRA
jgi:hypothetical protein